MLIVEGKHDYAELSFIQQMSIQSNMWGSKHDEWIKVKWNM